MSENCLYVRKSPSDRKSLREIISRGTQLPDLFAFLPADEAFASFSNEYGRQSARCACGCLTKNWSRREAELPTIVIVSRGCSYGMEAA